MSFNNYLAGPLTKQDMEQPRVPTITSIHVQWDRNIRRWLVLQTINGCSATAGGASERYKADAIMLANRLADRLEKVQERPKVIVGTRN